MVVNCYLLINISEIGKKAKKKKSSMILSKDRTVMNAIFKSQLNYYPLILTWHGRESNNKINRPHEKCLKIRYNDKQSSFDVLLQEDGSVAIHERNIKTLATEMFKVSKNLVRPQMRENKRQVSLKSKVQLSVFEAHW